MFKKLEIKIKKRERKTNKQKKQLPTTAKAQHRGRGFNNKKCDR